MTDFKALVDSSVQFEAEVERIYMSDRYGEEIIVFVDVYVNGEYFRDHTGVKMAKRLKKLKAGDKVTASATMIKYLSFKGKTPEEKLGFKSFREVKICNKNS